MQTCYIGSLLFFDRQLQLAEGELQLPKDLGALFTVYGAAGADDDQKPCLQAGTKGIVSGSDHSLCPISRHSRSDLFGDRNSQTVHEYLLGVFLPQPLGGKVLQHVDRYVLPHESLSVLVRLSEQMVFSNCDIFHVLYGVGCAEIKNPDARKTGTAFKVIGGFYLSHTDSINRSVFFCP